MQTVQLSIADAAYAATVREALVRSCAWHVGRSIARIRRSNARLVLDEDAFARLPLPLSHPERVVLITRKDPPSLSQAWDAGIVSVVSDDDPINTVLLAIMAAALRVAKDQVIAMPQCVYPPTEAIHLRQYPHKIGLPDRNVAKSNSLGPLRTWTLACTHVHSARRPS